MRRRRPSLVLLVLVLMVGLVVGACAKPKATEQETAASSQAGTATTGTGGSKTLRIITTGEPYGAALRKLGEIWEQRTGVKVVVDQFPYDNTYEKEVLLATTRSPDYDLMGIDCIWLPVFIKNGWVEPLDPYLADSARTPIDLDGFFPGAVDAYDRVDGKLYAVPIDFFIEIMAYRKDLFAARGITEPPVTWDEFLSVAEHLHDPDQGVYGVVTMPGEQDAGYSEWTVRLAGQQMPPGASQFVWDNQFRPVFNWNDQGVRALQLWLDTKPYNPPGSNEIGYAEATNLFAQGKAGLYISWFMTFSDLEDPQKSTVAGKIGYALPPRSPGSGDKYEYMGGFQLAINAFSRQKTGAYEFLAFAASDAGQELMLENGAPGAYRASVYSNPKWTSKYPWLVPTWEARGKIVPLTTGIGEYVNMQRLVYEELQAAWLGTKEPRQAMADAEARVTELFTQAGYLK